MTAKRFLGLSLTSILMAAATAAQVSPAGDPCTEARRIAQSQPCLAGADDCVAAQRWRQVFGPPGKGWAEPELTGTLPADLGSKLTGKKIPLKESEPLRSVLARLATASELELRVDPSVTGDFRTAAGTLPLREAWREVLGMAGLTARFAGSRVLVTRVPLDDGVPRTKPGVATGFNCRTR